MKGIKRVLVLALLFTWMITAISGGQIVETGSSPALRPGSSGKEVKELQQRLKNWGFFEGAVDGNYGMQTFLAVKDFQSNWGIRADGIAARDTLMAAGMSKFFFKNEAFAQGGTSEEQLLARAINGEARGEPYEGQVAVGAVILNRVRDPKFPKTVAGVIYQPGAFTAVSDGQINVPIESNATVVKAARDAMNGWDPTNGCLYYWNPATATSQWIWSREIRLKIGKHNFGI